jgi:hypothetical protein
VLVAVEHEAGADLEDVRALPEQARRDRHALLAPAGHEHHLDVGAQAGLDRARPQQRRGALAVVQQRPAVAEERRVEVEVQAAHRARIIARAAP